MSSWRRHHRPWHRSARSHWPLLGLTAGGGVAAHRRHRARRRHRSGKRERGWRGGPVRRGRAALAETATYYATRGMGNCSYPRPPADGLYVALSPPEYAKAARCGGYLEVRGPEGSVLVKVIDQRPGCAAGHIDLSETAFARLAPLSASLHQGHLHVPGRPAAARAALDRGQPRDRRGTGSLTGRQHRQPPGLGPGADLIRVAVPDAGHYNYWIASSSTGPGRSRCA